MPPLQLQFVSFSYDGGQPRDTLANVNARVLPNPGRAAKGRTGLDKLLALRAAGCVFGLVHAFTSGASLTPACCLRTRKMMRSFWMTRTMWM